MRLCYGLIASSRIIKFIVTVIILFVSAPLTFSQGFVSISQVDGLDGSGKILVNQPITFHVRFNNNSGMGNVIGFYHGFQLSSPDGASWGNLSFSFRPAMVSRFDLFDINEQITGRVSAYGVIFSKSGMEDGFSETALTFTTQFDDGDIGKTLCIDDAEYNAINGWEWVWISSSGSPGWGGPYCFDIVDDSPKSPSFTNCPVEISGLVGTVLEYDFDAVDSEEGLDVTYELLSGPGTIDPSSGYWSYTPTGVDIGTSLSISICASTTSFPCPTGNECVVPLNITGTHIEVIPGSLSFEAISNWSTPDSKQFQIINSGAGLLSWSVSDDASWLDLNPTAGAGNSQNITASIISTNITPGTYGATIIIDSDNADNPGVTIDVTYEVYDATFTLIKGPGQIGEVGDPIENGFIEIYRADIHVGTFGPTTSLGQIDLSSVVLEDGDEIYAYIIVGAGRTDKGLHPDIPDHLEPGDITGCSEWPWRAFYYLHLDNQYVSGGELQKVYFDNTSLNRTIELNHKIAKMNLALGFDHMIADDTYTATKTHIEEQMTLFNEFWLNATDGAIMLGSVVSQSNSNQPDDCDIWIQWDETPKYGDAITPGDLKTPGFIYGTFKTLFDRNSDFSDLAFYRRLAHEFGHYVLMLDEEYEKDAECTDGTDCYHWEFYAPPFARRVLDDYCTENFSLYHGSIMGNKVHLNGFEAIEEFCHHGHDQSCCLRQNTRYGSQYSPASCWNTIYSGWNSFPSRIVGGCNKYLIGDTLEWSLPESPYTDGPRLMEGSTTSHSIVFDWTEFQPASVDFAELIVEFTGEISGVYASIVSNMNPKYTLGAAALTNFDSVKYSKYIDESEDGKAIPLYVLEPNDYILVTAPDMIPVLVDPDTVGLAINITTQELLESSTFVDWIVVEISSGNILLKVYCSQSMTVAPEIAVFEDEVILQSGTATQISDTSFTVQFTPSSQASSGEFIVSHPDLPEIVIGQWGSGQIDQNNRTIEMMGGFVSVSVDSTEISGSTEVAAISTPLPQSIRALVLDETLPTSPACVAFSNPGVFLDSIGISFYAGIEYENDSTLRVSRYNESVGILDTLPAIFSINTYKVTGISDGEGLFLVSGHPELGCCINDRGNANNDIGDAANISDVSYLVAWLFGIPSGPEPICIEEANANGDVGETANISDISYLVAWLFGVPTGPAPPECP